MSFLLFGGGDLFVFCLETKDTLYSTVILFISRSVSSDNIVSFLQFLDTARVTGSTKELFTSLLESSHLSWSFWLCFFSGGKAA